VLQQPAIADERATISGAYARRKENSATGRPCATPTIRAAYRERNRGERLFNRLKQHRAIATRSDKLAEHYGALLLLAAILLWL